MSEQIAYLEKLLEGYRARYKNGEANLVDRIRVTAAKLDELKLKRDYEESKKKKPAPRYSVLHAAPRGGCCRGR